ncbi:MAG: hypothetical protein RLZZ24_901, partial [Pseudomonadota bacterium]
MDDFPPTPEAALARLEQVNPRDYAFTRNAIDGAVTYLSPYITHGYMSVPDIARYMYHRHRLGVQHKLVNELGWREYFQHLHSHLGEAGMMQPIRGGVLPDDAYSRELPEDVRYGSTQVPVIDQAVRALYTYGYVHNHARLWLASYLVHLRKVHWRVGADWMYSHLLDGDIASNYLSWQWVAGTLHDKPYFFNAKSIEPFTPPEWHSRGTSIDVSEEMMDILARNHATVSQAQPNEYGWEEPKVSHTPPEPYQLQAPDASVVAGRMVWLVHPWQLADPPEGLPEDAVCVAALWPESFAQHPWNMRRWQFVLERMQAITPHVWWGSETDMQRALSQARGVQTV